jgi:hypothetical protein
VWELTPDARQERVLLSPNLEFVYAEAVERVTEGGIVAIPVTEEFAVLDRDDPLGLIALWRTGNESVHMTLEVSGDVLTTDATFSDHDGNVRRTTLLLEPTACR